MQRPRLSLALSLSALAFCLSPACSGTPGSKSDKAPRFAHIEDTMESVIDPLAGDRLEQELNKDPKNVPFAQLREEFLHAASLFDRCSVEGDAFYLSKADQRSAAQAAAKWFNELAAAAADKQHTSMVRLFAQRQQVCSACHPY